MEIRAFNYDTDYKEVSRWWIAGKFVPITEGCLPENGLIVPDLCAGWLYKTDSCIGILEWLVGNPDALWDERGYAQDLVISSLKQLAKDFGMEALFTYCKHERLMKRYEDHGFKKTDENVTNFIGRI